jgi:hypothetical protein
MGTTLGKRDRETARKLKAQRKAEKRKRRRELQRQRIAFVESVVGQVGAVEKFKTFAP